MQHAPPLDPNDPHLPAASGKAGFADLDVGTELAVLREIVRLLPAAVTVQDRHGDFLLVNDAAATQFNAPAEDFSGGAARSDMLAQALHHRRTTALDLLDSGRSATFEERVSNGRDVGPQDLSGLRRTTGHQRPVLRHPGR